MSSMCQKIVIFEKNKKQSDVAIKVTDVGGWRGEGGDYLREKRQNQAILLNTRGRGVGQVHAELVDGERGESVGLVQAGQGRDPLLGRPLPPHQGTQPGCHQGDSTYFRFIDRQAENLIQV